MYVHATQSKNCVMCVKTIAEHFFFNGQCNSCMYFRNSGDCRDTDARLATCAEMVVLAGKLILFSIAKYVEIKLFEYWNAKKN